MQAIIDAVRAERELLLAPIADQLAKLDELERIASGPTNGAGGGPAVPAETPALAKSKPAQARKPAASRKPAPTGAGIDGLGPMPVQILQFVREHGQVTTAQILDATGVTASTLSSQMAVLVDRCLVERLGNNRNRTYRPVTNYQPPTVTVGLAAPKGAPKNGASVQGRILEAVGFRPMDKSELIFKLKAPDTDIASALQRLVTEGEIEQVTGGRYRCAA